MGIPVYVVEVVDDSPQELNSARCTTLKQLLFCSEHIADSLLLTVKVV